MKLLTAKEILEQDDTLFEDVEVPEWKGTVRIRALTATERDEFEESITRVVVKGRGKHEQEKREIVVRGIRAKLVARAAIGETGDRLFSDAEAEKLGRKSAAAMDRLFAVAQRLAGMTDKDVEELAGKSETAPSDSSSSG